MSKLLECLDGARVVRYDHKTGLLLVWYGGHGIHAVREDGSEAAFWNTGDFAQKDASEADVVASMERRMAKQDYPWEA
jgi:hypothetical protein